MFKPRFDHKPPWAAREKKKRWERSVRQSGERASAGLLFGNVAGGGFGGEDHEKTFYEDAQANQSDGNRDHQRSWKEDTAVQADEPKADGHANEESAAESVLDAIGADGGSALVEQIVYELICFLVRETIDH